MRLRISTTVFDEMQPAIEDAIANQKRHAPDPSDPVYLKLHATTWRQTGLIIEADEGEVRELLSRARYKIDVALENMPDEPAFWRGQLAAWRALIRQIEKASAPR